MDALSVVEFENDGKKKHAHPSKVKMFRIMQFMIRRLLRWLMWTLGCCMSPVCRLMSRQSYRLPHIENELLLKPAGELARLIRTKQVSSEAVITAYIDRCRAVNPMLNAIVQDRFDDALQEARNVDMLIVSGTQTAEQLEETMPLLGVPITIKESIAVQGMSNSAGSARAERKPADRDAECVQLVKAAGGIVLLVSNTPELCMSYETYNKVSGVTLNPYDTRRTPAGSSGGEAALLGSACSLLSLSSDIGGSLRLPAMFSGVFGHKPTPRLVSIEGHIPSCANDWADMFAIGPMTRYAVDMPLLLGVLSSRKFKHNINNTMKNVKVYYMEDDGNSGLTNPIDPEIINSMRSIVKHLSKTYGIQAQKVHLKDLKHSFEIFASMALRIDGVDSLYRDEMDHNQMTSFWPEVCRFITCKSKSNFIPVIYGPLKKLMDSLPESNAKRLNSINDSLKYEFLTMLGTDGVFLYPTFPTVAHYHYEFIYKVLDASYMMVFNNLGMPVTACTLGLNSQGLPLGIQVAANPGCDHLCLELACDLERAFGGWVPPPSAQV